MLRGLASYLFGGEKSDNERQENNFEYDAHEEDEWLLIDIAESVMEDDQKEEEYHMRDISIVPSPSVLAPTLSVLTVHLPECRFSSPPRSPTQMEGSWYVTPPPCFTAGGPIQVQMSPLENLLIEHPSMSVYTATPSSSLSITALSKELRCEPESEPLETEVIENVVSKSISVEFLVEKKKSKLNQTATNRRVHQESSLPLLRTDLFEQIANIKRGQKAKHYFEQKALQRSKLDRQNLTNHYLHSSKNPRRKDHWHNHSGANNNRKC